MRVETPYIHLVPKDPLQNHSFRRRCIEYGRDNEQHARELWIMCARDPLFYANVFCWQLNAKDYAFSPVRPLITHDQQDECVLAVLRAFGDHDLGIFKSRDVGGTTIGLILPFEWAWHFRDYQSFLLVSREKDMVDSSGETGSTNTLFDKLDFLHKYQPRWLLPTGYHLSRKKNPNRTEAHAGNPDNGSVLDGDATTSDLSVGDKRTAIGLDERGLMPNSELISLGTREATKSRISNSTPRGTAGDGREFYRLWRDPHLEKVVLHWSRHPEKAVGLYTSINNRLVVIDKSYDFPEDYDFVLDGDKTERLGYEYVHNGVRVKVRSPWYDNECKRAGSDREIAQELDINFLESGQLFFDAGVIDELQRGDKATVLPSRGKWSVAVKDKRLQLVDVGEKHLELWFDPGDSRDAPWGEYVVASDVAWGVGGAMSSPSSAVIYNNATREKVGQYVRNDINPSEYADVLAALCRWFHDARVIWENNGPGRILVKNLYGAPNFYRRVYMHGDPEDTRRRHGHKPGWESGSKSKLLLLAEYRRALKAREIINTSRQALDECLEYIQPDDKKVVHSKALSKADADIGDTGESHGDLVIADALAWKLLSERPRAAKPRPAKMPRNCLAARIAAAEREEQLALDEW